MQSGLRQDTKYLGINLSEVVKAPGNENGSTLMKKEMKKIQIDICFVLMEKFILLKCLRKEICRSNVAL